MILSESCQYTCTGVTHTTLICIACLHAVLCRSALYPQAVELHFSGVCIALAVYLSLESGSSSESCLQQSPRLHHVAQAIPAACISRPSTLVLFIRLCLHQLLLSKQDLQAYTFITMPVSYSAGTHLSTSPTLYIMTKHVVSAQSVKQGI